MNTVNFRWVIPMTTKPPDYHGHFEAGFEEVIFQIPKDGICQGVMLKQDLESLGLNIQMNVYFEVPYDGSPIETLETEAHQFRVFKTGEVFFKQEGEEFVGRVSINTGEHVFHVYRKFIGKV